MDSVHGGARAHSPDNELGGEDRSPQAYGVHSELMAPTHDSDVTGLREHADGADLYDGAARDGFDPSGIDAALSGAESMSQPGQFDSPEVGTADQGCLVGGRVAMSGVPVAIDATGLEQSDVQQTHDFVGNSGLVTHMHGSLTTLVNSDYALQSTQQVRASTYQILPDTSVDSLNPDATALDPGADQGDCDGRYEGELREQDRFLPIANVARIMKRNIPKSGKISKEAKECVQECVSEFISFITSEASERCQQEKRKTINGDDILYAMQTLGFDNYIEPLRVFLQNYREFMRGERGSNPSQMGLGDDMEDVVDEHSTMSGGADTPSGQAFPTGLIADHTGSTQPPASTPIFTTQYGVTTQITQAMSY
ncbi:uncharacterized protein LOC134197148 isoform X2 [Corticium candelabrum]|nr:uncharacterized protein LOC134197148 isoform X2 [Corticium candelabrum]